MTDAPGFEILLEDGPCLVVAKPAGIATQAPPQFDSLEARVRRFLAARDGKTGNFYLGVPHRLDRPVSGVAVLARHVRAARRLAEQFETRTVRKTYAAFVACDVPSSELPSARGTWIDFVRKIPDKPQAEIVAEQCPAARRAVLHYLAHASGPGMTLLEIELETGRMHQIRVQAAARGLPILGDTLYGSDVDFGPTRSDGRERAIALHARSLTFEHPMTRQRITAVAPWPEYWPSQVQ